MAVFFIFFQFLPEVSPCLNFVTSPSTVLQTFWWDGFGYLQGGSDISGTLSKLHRCIKKSYFLLIISHKTVLALFRSVNKNKQTPPGKY
jgi:hypothetical protein